MFPVIENLIRGGYRSAAEEADRRRRESSVASGREAPSSGLPEGKGAGFGYLTSPRRLITLGRGTLRRFRPASAGALKEEKHDGP